MPDYAPLSDLSMAPQTNSLENLARFAKTLKQHTLADLGPALSGQPQQQPVPDQPAPSLESRLVSGLRSAAHYINPAAFNPRQPFPGGLSFSWQPPTDTRPPAEQLLDPDSRDQAMNLGLAFTPGGIGKIPAGGLEFPAAEAADRLRLLLGRTAKATQAGEPLPGAPSNPRTVIRAPEAAPGQPQLPDFVSGDVTFQDWIARHEKLMSPQEILKASKWYDEIYDQFLQHTNGDDALAKRLMRGWLVANQNVSVGSAMQNALLQREQVLRGTPEAQMVAGGMPNPTIAARRIMQGQPLEGGVGQKISDFVDSAEKKDVRSWMGNDPQGGEPFVVDVHSARDTGMVDEELINHLKRLGYNQEDMANLTKDLGTSPSATQYENRADFGRRLTDHLNAIKWQGKSDWTPRQVQAVGWMGMTRLTGNRAEDVLTALQSQMRHLSMELSPGEGSPWAEKYGDRYNALSPSEQWALTHQVAQSAVDRASELAGVDVRGIVHGTGGWQTFQNPSTVAQTFSSPQGAEIAANALGHMLQQTEVWSNKVKPVTSKPGGFAVDFIGEGNHNLTSDAGIRDFWGKIMAADPSGLFQGYQPIRTPDGRTGIRVLVDQSGLKTQKALQNAVAGPIDQVIKSLPADQTIRTKIHEAEITKARNDWTQDRNGEAYTRRLFDLLRRDPTADLDRHGQELEAQFRAGLERAEGRAAQRAGPAPVEPPP